MSYGGRRAPRCRCHLIWGTFILFYIQEATSAKQPTRFWIDDYAFSEGETAILREQIQASEGAAVISGEALTQGFLTSRGYFSPELWDVYWANRQACVRALPHTRPGQRVSCLPGTTALSRKGRLVGTLLAAYGSGAFGIIPRTFLLPQQYWDWRLWLADMGDAGQEERLWVLKEDAHRGQGVAVVPEAEALAKAGSARLEVGQGGLEMVQAYLGNQYTVAGRKFYLRVWVVLSNVDPLQVLLWRGGVVPFGPARAGNGSCLASSAPAGPPDQASQQDELIVNLWRNRGDAVIWDVEQFRAHLLEETGSSAAFQRLWRGVERGIGLTFAAAQPALHAAARQHFSPPGVAFELLGVDFLVDTGLQPWLLEVNAVPSMARQEVIRETGCPPGPAPINAFDRQKELFIAGLFRLLVASVQTGSSQPSADSAGSSAAAEAEAARKLGFVPLCAVSQEAVQLSAEHQRTMQSAPGQRWDPMYLQSWQAVLCAGFRRLWAAAESLPRACAAFVFQTLPPDLLMLLSEKAPVLDRVLLGAKRLARPTHVASGWVPAALQLEQDRADAELCKQLCAGV